MPKTTKTSSALEAPNVFSTCSRTVTLLSFRSCLGPPIREELPAARIIAEITPDGDESGPSNTFWLRPWLEAKHIRWYAPTVSIGTHRDRHDPDQVGRQTRTFPG